jgi:Flp pilus assembly protein TadD
MRSLWLLLATLIVLGTAMQPAMAAPGRTDEKPAVADQQKQDAARIKRIAELLQDGRGQEACEIAQEAVNSDPTNASLWATLSYAQLCCDRGQEAEAAGLKALELDPGNERAMGFTMMARMETGDLQGALEMVGRLETLKPLDMWLLKLKGKLQYQLGEMLGAQSTFQSYLAQSPEDAEALAWLAWVELVLGKADEADQHARASEAIERSAQAETLICIISAFRGDTDEAARIYAQTAQQFPDDEYTFLAGYVVAMKQKDYSGAMQLCSKVLAAGQDADAFSLLDLAALSSSGESAEALAQFESYVEAHPEDIMGLINTGVAALMSGDRDKAARYLRRADELALKDGLERQLLDKVIEHMRSLPAWPYE